METLKNLLEKNKKAIKNNIGYFLLVVFMAVFILLFLRSIFNNTTDTRNEEKLIILQYELERQKEITDSILKKGEVVMYEVKKDTVFKEIKIKYENEKIRVINLSPNEQLLYISRWLSEEDAK